MLANYFWKMSYSGNFAIPEEILDRYVREISKPGFLRAGLEYFATTKADAEFFNSIIGTEPFQQPILVLGGEASLAPLVNRTWSAVGTNVATDVVPKAGHWLGS